MARLPIGHAVLGALLYWGYDESTTWAPGYTLAKPLKMN